MQKKSSSHISYRYNKQWRSILFKYNFVSLIDLLHVLLQDYPGDRSTLNID